MQLEHRHLDRHGLGWEAVTASAALIGLLFVAVSVRDDSIFGPKATPGGEALAITAFTGLVNSLVVSLLGLIPKVNIGEPAVIAAVIGDALDED